VTNPRVEEEEEEEETFKSTFRGQKKPKKRLVPLCVGL